MNIDKNFFIRNDITDAEHGRHNNFSSTKLEKTLVEDLRRTSKTVTISKYSFFYVQFTGAKSRLDYSSADSRIEFEMPR